MALSLDHEDLIYRLAYDCEGIFDQLHAVLTKENRQAAILELCTEFQQRFSIWAAHLGVFARKSQSLDTRLRNLPDLQDLVVRLLDILRRSLQQCEAETSSKDSDLTVIEQSQPKVSRVLTAGLRAIDDTLTRLSHLGVTIRRSNSSTLDLRAQEFAESLDLKPFTDLCARAVQALYPDAHQSLKDYLSKSMTDRYARMQFLNSRNKKLKTRRQPVPRLEPIWEVPNNETQTNMPIQRAEAATEKQVGTSLPRGSNAFSQSDLSGVNIQQIRSRLRPPDEASTTFHKTSSIQVSQGRYPPPPATEKASGPFTCDWCSELLSKNLLAESEWCRHIDRDLKPYVCLSESCPEAHPAYPSFDEWFKHMALHSRRWHEKVYLTPSWACIVCESNSDTFSNPQALYSHLEASHLNDFTSTQLQTISRQSKMEQSRARNDCLLCCFAVEEQLHDGDTVFPKRHKKNTRQSSTKSARETLQMTSPDPHSSDSSSPDTSADSDSEVPRRHRPEVIKDNAKSMARHVAAHLQLLMLLTLRFAALQIDDGELYEDIRSDSVDVEEGNSALDNNNLGRLSDIVPNFDIPRIESDNSEHSEVNLDLLDIAEDDIPVPDTNFNLGVISSLYKHLAPEDDAFLAGVIRSGAYQSWRDEEWFSTSSLETRFNELRNHLPQHKSLRYSMKIAVILDDIGCRDKILEVLESGFTDYWLPVPLPCMPECLSPGAIEHFNRRQLSFLDDTFYLTHHQHQHLSPYAANKERRKIPRSLSWMGLIEQGGLHVSMVKSTDEKLYALKRIARINRYSGSMAQMKSIQEELEVLKKIAHHHCIKLVGSYGDLDAVGIVMDPVADCNLATFLDYFLPSNPRFNEQQVFLASFFGCLSTALEYLHYQVSICHGDINPSNILVKANIIMLTNFGMSFDWSETGQMERKETGRMQMYSSPESTETGLINWKTDIWGLGCVFLEMVAVLKGRWGNLRERLGTYEVPFEESLEGIQEIIQTLESEGMSCDNVPLMWARGMLERDKDARPDSRKLKGMILQSRGQTDRVFCGSCCEMSSIETAMHNPETPSVAEMTMSQTLDEVFTSIIEDSREAGSLEVEETIMTDSFGHQVEKHDFDTSMQKK